MNTCGPTKLACPGCTRCACISTYRVKQRRKWRHTECTGSHWGICRQGYHRCCTTAALLWWQHRWARFVYVSAWAIVRTLGHASIPDHWVYLCPKGRPCTPPPLANIKCSEAHHQPACTMCKRLRRSASACCALIVLWATFLLGPNHSCVKHTSSLPAHVARQAKSGAALLL